MRLRYPTRMTTMTPRPSAPTAPPPDRPRWENGASGPPSRSGRGRRPADRSAAELRSACCDTDRHPLRQRKGVHRRRSPRRSPAAAGWRRNRDPSCSSSGETSGGRRPDRPADRRTTAPGPRSRAPPSHSVPSLSRRPAPRRAHRPGRRWGLLGPCRPWQTFRARHRIHHRR